MLRINKITRGRWGNKVFQYNNLVQLGSILNVKISCGDWDGSKYFKNIIPNINNSSNKPEKILYWDDILNNDFNTIKDMLNDFTLLLDDPSYALHNTFYKLTRVNPRFFLELKDEYIPKLDNNNINVGIHIRGGDILGGDGQDGREIHTPTYYKNAIDFIIKSDEIKERYNNKKIKFLVCTDDITFASYTETIKYLKEQNYNYETGPNTGSQIFINDFAVLCYCDILINSSSTFCCASVFIGKEDKYIIHSKDWLDRIVKCDFSNNEYKKYNRVWTHKYNDIDWKKSRKAYKYWQELKCNLII